nr:MAG TPA: hypothetical protein [Bacteriophage sp.]
MVRSRCRFRPRIAGKNVLMKAGHSARVSSSSRANTGISVFLWKYRPRRLP